MSLSTRQVEIIVFLSQGWSQQSISEIKNLAKSTVYLDIKRAMDYYKCKNVAHLVATAIRLGIIK